MYIRYFYRLREYDWSRNIEENRNVLGKNNLYTYTIANTKKFKTFSKLNILF